MDRGIARIGAVGVALSAALALAPAASAASTFTVTGTGDAPGAVCTGTSCPTLRAAITAANASPGSTIDLPGASSTYQLSGSQLDITEPMTLSGAGGTIAQQTHSGARVLLIASASAGSVTVSDLAITGGNLATSASGGVVRGGGVLIQAATTGVEVTFNGVTVSGNTATGNSPMAAGDGGGGGYGGGIDDETSAALTITNSIIEGNTAKGGDGAQGSGSAGGFGGSADGGGLHVGDVGLLTITGTQIDGNHSDGGTGGLATGTFSGGGGGTGTGGGLGDANAATVLDDDTWNQNTATGGTGGGASLTTGTQGGGGSGYGAGIELSHAGTLSAATVSGNVASAGPDGAGHTPPTLAVARGGGLWIGSSDVVVTGSTFTHNESLNPTAGAEAQGGAVEPNNGGYTGIIVVNSTLFANSAAGQGGGIYSYSQPITLASDTLDANTAPHGGDINSGVALTIKATDTIIAGGNPASTSGDCAGTVADLAPGHNLEDDTGVTAQCGFSTAAHDVVGVTPGLPSALAANGGPTETLAPAPGSPALDAGGACIDPTSGSGTAPLTADQRGQPRDQSACDIGAFEAQPASAGSPGPSVSGTPEPGQTLTCANGTWTGDALTFAYQWLRNGSAIASATTSSYVIPSADVGARLACRVTATGAYGGTPSATSAAVTVRPLPAPVLGHLKQSHKQWRESGHAGKHRPPVGTTFSFALSQAAKVTFTFTPSGRHHRAAGVLTVRSHRGANRVSFHGQLGHGHKLKPGKYTVSVVASAGGQQAKRQTLHFTILR